jgi:hypothetical protein
MALINPRRTDLVHFCAITCRSLSARSLRPLFSRTMNFYASLEPTMMTLADARRETRNERELRRALRSISVSGECEDLRISIHAGSTRARSRGRVWRGATTTSEENESINRGMNSIARNRKGLREEIVAFSAGDESAFVHANESRTGRFSIGGFSAPEMPESRDGASRSAS